MDHNVNMQQSRDYDAFVKFRDAMQNGLPDYAEILQDIVCRLDLIEAALAPQIERVKRERLARKAQAVANAHPEGRTQFDGKNISVTVYDTI